MEKTLYSDARIFVMNDSPNVSIAHDLKIVQTAFDIRIVAEWKLYIDDEPKQARKNILIEGLWELAEYVKKVEQEPFPSEIQKWIDDLMENEKWAGV